MRKFAIKIAYKQNPRINSLVKSVYLEEHRIANWNEKNNYQSITLTVWKLMHTNQIEDSTIP
jgi:hypothetical protein